MYKILHTADLHLGKKFAGSDFDLYEIQKLIMEEIIEVAEKEKVDIVIFAGDIFDTNNNPVKTEKLFYNTVKQLSGNGERIIITIAGNHDSAQKFELLRPFSEDLPYFITAGNPAVEFDFYNKIGKFKIKAKGRTVNIEKNEKKINIVLLPYPAVHRMKGNITDKEEFNKLSLADKIKFLIKPEKSFKADETILVSHLFITEGKESDSEFNLLGGLERLPISIFEKSFNYIALGHLHSFQNIKEKAFYPGAIFPFTKKELKKKNKSGVIIKKGDKIKFVPFKITDKTKYYKCKSYEEAMLILKNKPDMFYYFDMEDVQMELNSDKELKKSGRGKIIKVEYSLSSRNEIEEMEEIKLEELKPDIIFTGAYKNLYKKEASKELVELFMKIYSEVI